MERKVVGLLDVKVHLGVVRALQQDKVGWSYIFLQLCSIQL